VNDRRNFEESFQAAGGGGAGGVNGQIRTVLRSSAEAFGAAKILGVLRPTGLTLIKSVSAVTFVAGHQNLKRSSLVCALGFLNCGLDSLSSIFSFSVEFRKVRRRYRE
jgi:hypothetical protein